MAVFYNQIVAAMTPRLELSEVAKGNDPAALLARRLVLLREGGEQSRRLLAEARDALAPTAGDEIWAHASDHRGHVDPLSDDALCDVLERSGMAALTEMLSKSGRGTPS